MLDYLDPFAILGQRVIWSVLVLFPILFFTKQLYKVKEIIKNPKQISIIFLSSAFIIVNWFAFVWTVNSNMTVEASLGYFISPLLNMILAGILLKEKTTRLKKIAIIIFGLTLLFNIFSYGEFPIYSCAIGGTFAIYAFLHKIINTDPIPAFFLEMLILSPFCVFLLTYILPGDYAIVGYPPSHYFLLFSTIFYTATPLLLYTYGVKYLTLTNVSIIQYISPCLAFLLAVFVIGDPVKPSDYITFPMLWLALGICTYDILRTYRKTPKRVLPVDNDFK